MFNLLQIRQSVIAIFLSQLATARRKLDVANVEWNIKSPTVDRVHLVTLDIQTVDHANVTLTELKDITANHRTANVRANQTLPVITVNDVLMVFMVPNVNHVNVI